MVMQILHSHPRRICACVVLMTGGKEIFNNKIKIALLILICSSMWNSCKCIGVEDSGHNAVYNNNNNKTNVSNLYEQLEINIGGENEAVKAIFMGKNYGQREKFRSFASSTYSKNNGVLFKREMTESEQRESAARCAESATSAESSRKNEAKYIHQEQRGEAQNEVIATATHYDNNIYVTTTTVKNNVEINENQNEKNNDNENVKWPKVVDSEITPTTTISPESAIALFTKIPPKSATATAANEEERKEANEATKCETEPPLVDVTAALQQKLIYEFAIKYKLIPHVTFFTCRWLSSGSHGVDGNFGEQMTYLNMQTLEIMERMYGSRSSSNLAVDKKRSETGASKAKKATTEESVPAETTRKTTRASGNSNSKRTITSTQATIPLNGNATHSGRGSDGGATSRSLVGTPLRDILIKVVHIDQLINKRPFAAFKNKNSKNNQQQQQRNNWNAKRTFDGGFTADGARFTGNAGSRNAYTNANWLSEVLRDVGNRQIVVLNLACGAASRRLLEMASIKALFNSTYHWLLMEDYTFNRRTDNDDNVNKSNNNRNHCNTTHTDQSNESVDDNNSNGDVDDDVESAVDKFSQRKQRQQQENGKVSLPATAFTSTSAALATRTAIAAPATVNNEETMEIIEKYLEKINININTELILAKRHTRRIRDNVDVGCVVKSCRTDSESATNNTLQRTDYYQLYDVWNPGLQYGGQLNISEIGYFALDDGLQIALWYRRSTTITRRMNMKMARIRCLIVVTNKNFTDTLEHYLTTPYDTHLDSMNRFNFALLSNVRDLYNFSFVMSKTASWGYLKNGKFDGMIGALVRKQADIGGSPIFFRIERAKVIDYTTRTWVARPCFIFRHPPSTKKDRIVFLQPFSNTVWILLGLCGIFTICLLWLLTTVERKLAAAGVVRQLGIRNDTRGSVNKTNNKSKQQQAIGVNGEQQVRDGCSAWMTVSDGTMPCDGAYKNAFSSLGRITKEQQRKQKLQKLVKRDKRERRQKHEQNISFRHCMLGCGNACCGQTGTDVAQQRVGLFFESLLFYVGSICQQGLTFSTSFFSGRCIVITSLLFAFAIYQFYSASIVGTLLMEKPKTIRTLRDLIHSSLAVGVEDIPYNRDYFLRTKDPIAIELYAKKVTSVPTDNDPLSDMAGENVSTLPTVQPTVQLTEAEKAKAYRDILHSHETGAHAKTNEASNWYDPEYGVKRIRRGKFAFHVDVATAYKIIADTFNEKEICDLTEIQLFPPQKMVNIVQKGSPLRKIITYGLRRVTETGLMDYQRKVWHSPKPRCVKQIHTDDLRVDLQTFASALLVLIFGYAVSLLALSIEIIQHKLYERYEQEHEEKEEEASEDVDDDENVEQEYE